MNDGFVNEDLLRDYINHNTFNDYNNNIKSFLKFLFSSNIDENSPFFAEKKGGQIKPDLCITHKGIEKYISIKKGSGNSVHQEPIDVFFPFFGQMLGADILTNLKYFHYGDDTTDDSGTTRYNAAECKERYSEQINEINSAINADDKVVKFLDRFLFTGNVGSITANAIYHGTIEDGLWASREEIINYVKNNSFLMNAIHFGPLTYQVWGRDEKRTAVHPERRYVMQVKWGSITTDLKNIREES